MLSAKFRKLVPDWVAEHLCSAVQGDGVRELFTLRGNASPHASEQSDVRHSGANHTFLFPALCAVLGAAEMQT